MQFQLLSSSRSVRHITTTTTNFLRAQNFNKYNNNHNIYKNLNTHRCIHQKLHISGRMGTVGQMNGIDNHQNRMSDLHQRQRYFTSLLREQKAQHQQSGTDDIACSASENDDIERQYKTTLQALESLIVLSVPKNRRADDVLQVNNVQAMKDYVARLELDVGALKIIHVAGTKGKGSTCALCERMLRESGLKTGMYTSPHLIDVRERIRVNGEPIDKSAFVKHFWDCWDRLDRTRNDMYPSMATYFRFMTLLALKYFIAEKVDVAIIEVGLGGRLDATNFLQPVVCGINSIGYDHLDVLGDTIEKIASEKAGIIKRDVPVITTHAQRPEAMHVIEEHAKSIGAPLYVAADWNSYVRGNEGRHLSIGLSGEHQQWNATLAIALCQEFLNRTQHSLQQSPPSILEREDQPTLDNYGSDTLSQVYPVAPLSSSFQEGLALCRYSGRGQVMRFPERHTTFYLDSAHTVESVELCRKWFESELEKASHESICRDELDENGLQNSDSDEEMETLREIVMDEKHLLVQGENSSLSTMQPRILTILVFQFTGNRNPKELLEPLAQGERQVFDHVVFCPMDSEKTSLTRRSKLDEKEREKLEDLKEAWDQISTKHHGHSEHILICDSINHVFEWLWHLSSTSQHQCQPVDIRVLVTGSVYLVGDFMRKILKIKSIQR